MDKSYWRWLNQNVFELLSLETGTRETFLVSNVPMAFSPSVFQSTIKRKPHWLRKILPCCAVIQSRFLRSLFEKVLRLKAPGITTGSECEWFCQGERGLGTQRPLTNTMFKAEAVTTKPDASLWPSCGPVPMHSEFKELCAKWVHKQKLESGLRSRTEMDVLPHGLGFSTFAQCLAFASMDFWHGATSEFSSHILLYSS